MVYSVNERERGLGITLCHRRKRERGKESVRESEREQKRESGSALPSISAKRKRECDGP